MRWLTRWHTRRAVQHFSRPNPGACCSMLYNVTHVIRRVICNLQRLIHQTRTGCAHGSCCGMLRNGAHATRWQQHAEGEGRPGGLGGLGT